MRVQLTTFCIVLLALIAGFAVLQAGRELFAPIVAAFVLGVVMTPLSEFWERLSLPAALGAFLSVFLALASILLLLVLFEPYITTAIRHAPLVQYELRETLNDLRSMFGGLQQISEDMAAAIEPEQAEDAAPEEQMQLPSITDALFYAPQFLAQFLIFTGTLYFFLLVRNEVYDWLSNNVRILSERDLRAAAKQVSRYVLTITMINAGLGAVVTVVMSMLGMPSPVLWGMLAFVLNFILYLGPAALVVMLTVVGIVVFDGAASFLPPALYLIINATEAQFVTPTLVGRSLSVNPLLVFLSLVFWLWLWGPIGGIIAIPILIWVLTVSKGVKIQTISDGTPGRI